ncbi:stage II sporulation protein M [Paenibacillus sp.]|uniref:stage II sporulation protein M n=1 Tax=Paenibacillus sp. TaxID=58172 RepID=UPI002810F8EB|nr:stage II sporulation protein M [Paenibacillus sp.]
MTGVFRVYTKDLLPLYLFVCILFIMGVVFGALLVNALTLQQKHDVGQYVNTFLSGFGGSAAGLGGTGAAELRPAGAGAVWDAFGAHARWVFFIWILGLSVVGVPLILLLDFLKGVLIGFTVGYLAGQWSWDGIVFAIVSVAPQNLVVVPAIIVCSVAAISFSLLLVRGRLLHRSGTVKQPLASFSLTALLLTGLMLAVSLFEVYVSPGLLEWAAPMLLDAV